jgi:hypothetical protein
VLPAALNETLAELADDHVFLGEWLYFIAILGRPPRANHGVGSSAVITPS